MNGLMLNLDRPKLTLMGSASIISGDTIQITSHIITYGNAATPEFTERIRDEIAAMWNAPKGITTWKDKAYFVIFNITAEYNPALKPEDIFDNDNPEHNYFRIENFASGNISFVDALGSNTGYFLSDNLYEGSTTAAHEYGHTLGLPHPSDLDFRGRGVPGIMYPRGTLVDAPFQYDPAVPAGQLGGTMHPKFRKVRGEDVAAIRIDHLLFKPDKLIVGNFTSIWHDAQTAQA